MRVYIDNNDVEHTWGITVLDWMEAFGVAAIRENSRIWEDKSGTDEALQNRRYESRPFTLTCYVKEATVFDALSKIKVLTSYLFAHPNFVLSFRQSPNKRFAILCHRNSAITSSNLNIRAQNALYVFSLSLVEVNPYAVKYYTTVQDEKITINYTKGKNAVIYWGNGARGVVSNSQEYTHTMGPYFEDAEIEVIIDVDNDADAVAALVCNFTVQIHTGILPDEVVFTDTSTGGAVLYSWDFGDGTMSTEQHPKHIYTVTGVYTVQLQVFNSVQGTAICIQEGVVTIRRPRMLINSDSFLLKSTTTGYLLKQ